MSEPDRQPPKSRPWEQGADAADGSFGCWLRRQREIREISLREIAETSKISLRYLEALEQDRFDLLPATVFAKGFLREYAKFVGLDPDEVVNYYLVAERGGEAPVEERPPPPPPPTRSHWTQVLWLAAGIVLAFGLVSALSFFAERGGGADSRPPMAAPPPLDAAVPESPAEEIEELAPLRVTLDFTQNCWVEAFVDGERRVSELRVQGESLQIEAEAEVQLSLNNVAGVYIEVNGMPLTVTSQNDEMFTIDLSTVQTLEEAS